MPVLAFVCFAIAGPVCAQPAPATAEPSQPAAPSQDVSYAGGLLQIDALDITLSELLTKVAAATGAAVDMPHRAYEERMHLVRLGPAPARQVIASLLSSASVDYMIQASSVDPEKVQKVLVIARSSAPAGNASDSPSESRAVIARAGALGETVSPSGAAPDSPVISAEAEKPGPAPEPEAPTPDAPLRAMRTQSASSDSARPSNPPPPSVLTPDAITQQLQQMYQQRVQLQTSQQTSPAVAPPR